MPENKTTTRGWPPARRARQAQLIRQTRPWLRATGPRTAAGKACSCRNAYKHGFRTPAMAGIRALLRWQRATLKSILAGRPPSPKLLAQHAFKGPYPPGINGHALFPSPARILYDLCHAHTPTA